jgi:hypothetical protein
MNFSGRPGIPAKSPLRKKYNYVHVGNQTHIHKHYRVASGQNPKTVTVPIFYQQRIIYPNAYSERQEAKKKAAMSKIERLRYALTGNTP